jgi:putative endonuclease
VASKQHILLGQSSEDVAAAYLKQSGYVLRCRNYRCFAGEIDIIAQDTDTLCFIEVKARRSVRFGLPQEAVSLVKQRHISRVALTYLKEKKLLGTTKARFDVVSVRYAGVSPQVTLIKNAFELSAGFC